MGSKRNFDRLEIWVIGGAVTTIIITLVIVIYSISTISQELYSGLSPSQPSVAAVEFNISAYNALGL